MPRRRIYHGRAPGKAQPKHRKPVLAHKNAPPGHCRVCGLWCSTELTGRQRQWHDGRQKEPNCLLEWRIWTRPKVAMRELRKRDGVKCVVEGCQWSGLEVDHRIPLIDGGTFGLENLQLLCTQHHKEKTAQEATDRARRRREES